MKCFYHRNLDAIGNCKSCGKGLCPDCAVDLGRGLACRNKCEEDARALIALIEHNITMYPKSAKLLEPSQRALAETEGIPTRAAIFNVVIGAIFLFGGLINPKKLAFLIIGGICFLIYGAISFFKSRTKNPRDNGGDRPIL
jgi:hypothetical protein